MHRSKELHSYMLERAKNLTEEWYASLSGTDAVGVYASTDPEVIKKLKQQNFEFHLHAIEIFAKDECEFFDEFNDWIVSVAKDPEHLKTPIHVIIREFARVRRQYIDYINDFAAMHENEVTQKDIDRWTTLIIHTFDVVVERFVKESYEHQLHLIQAEKTAHRQAIMELSTPIIPIDDGVGVLPIVGEVDTHRAKLINQLCLQKGAELKLEYLVIDVSGVPIMDTMVANELFQVVKGLSLLGIHTAITGITPVIAQTSVSLGLDFSNIRTYATLKQALANKGKRKVKM